MNPGSPAPQAGILDQTRRRPLETGLRPCSSIEGKIVKTLIKLKRSGLSEGALRTVSNNLKHLAKHCNLDDVESVKEFIANKKCDNSFKISLIKSYNYYAVTNNLQCVRAKYRTERKLPKIPTRENIMKVISTSSFKYATIFRILMETGIMPYELSRMKVSDIDLEKGVLTVRGYKGHSSRAPAYQKYFIFLNICSFLALLRFIPFLEAF